MPRKKTVTNRKLKPTKRGKASSNTTQKLEKEFEQAPGKIIAQLNKEIKTLKRAENKLKVALNKNNSTLKRSEAKLKTSTKQPAGLKARKQLSTAKKAHTDALKLHSQLERQSNETKTLLETINNKHAKLVALTKHLAEFEKTWNKKSKKVVPQNNVKKEEANVETTKEEQAPASIFRETEDATYDNIKEITFGEAAESNS